MRRSLTITDDNEKRIQQFRSLMLGGETPVDMDFTTVTNLFVELGHALWSSMRNTEGPVSVQRDLVSQIILKHLGDSTSADRAVEDMFVDWLNRKLWEQQLKQTQTVPNKK